MKLISIILFILSSVSFVLADIAISNGDKNTEKSGTCLGFTLFVTALVILSGWLLKKGQIEKR